MRMPVDVLAELDRIAKAEGRSRAQVIIRKCSGPRTATAVGSLEPMTPAKVNKVAERIAAKMRLPKAIVESDEEPPDAMVGESDSMCKWCGGKTKPWGTGRRCDDCKRNQ